jgi:predicted lipid carrier protein YhbT
MEAMLALRNALDDCNVDLPADLGRGAGPFAPVVRTIAGFVRGKALAADTKEDTPSWN